MTRIKICGIREPQTIEAITRNAIDAVGFNFWPNSRRFVEPDDAALLSEQLGSKVLRIGLFVDPTPEYVREVLSVCKIDLLQLHGSESPAFCRSLGTPFMKAFPLRDPSVLARIPDYLDSEDHPYLVDAWSPAGPGGTGTAVNLTLAQKAREEGTKMFLAGGLTPHNVSEAIAAVKPWAVDVASGVEGTSGDLDPSHIQAFGNAVRWSAKQ